MKHGLALNCVIFAVVYITRHGVTLIDFPDAPALIHRKSYHYIQISDGRLL